MKYAKKKHVEILLENSDIIYDRYNYEKDFAILLDVDGVEVARKDFDTSTDTFEDVILVDDKEYKLCEYQKEMINDYLWENVEEDYNEKQDYKKESQETPYHYLNN